MACIDRLINGISRLVNCMNRLIDGINRLIHGWGAGPVLGAAAPPGTQVGPPQPLDSRLMPCSQPVDTDWDVQEPSGVEHFLETNSGKKGARSMSSHLRLFKFPNCRLID